MGLRFTKWTLVLSSGFVGLTALGGGLALSLGLEGARFPLAWLSGTPFSSYFWPGLLLAIVVGGNAIAAFVLLLRRSGFASRWSAWAGACLAGFILVEVLILKQAGPVPTPMEWLYLCLGGLMAAFGLWRHRLERLERNDLHRIPE